MPNFNVSDDLKEFKLPQSAPIVQTCVEMLTDRDLRVVSNDEFLQAVEDRLNDDTPFEAPKPSEYSATDAEFPG